MFICMRILFWLVNTRKLLFYYPDLSNTLKERLNSLKLFIKYWSLSIVPIVHSLSKKQQNKGKLTVGKWKIRIIVKIIIIIS